VREEPTIERQLIKIESSRKPDESWLSKTLLIEPTILEGFALEEDLLISAVWKPPFMGGLFSLKKGSPTKLTTVDRLSTTGLWKDCDRFVRSIYHTDQMILYVYTSNGTACVANANFRQVHDVRFQFGQIMAVSTGTNEVVQFDADGNISYQWKFPGEQASWHLNCIDVWDGRYVVSCFGRRSNPSQYKGSWKEEGVVFDLESGDVLWSKLTKPHTPRTDAEGRQYVCDSDTNRLLIRNSPAHVTEIHFPRAFTRGLAFGKNHIYVGLSAIRHRGVDEIGPDSIPNARLAVLDKNTLKIVGQLDLPSAEVYDILITS